MVLVVLNYQAVDNFSVTSGERDYRNEYDFLGYNVYVDGVLNNPFMLVLQTTLFI